MAGARSSIKWYGGQVAKELDDEMQRRLRLVGEMLRSKIVRNLSTPGPEHSAPGEFPHAITGNLRKSVVYEHKPRENVVEVGTSVEYANRLENELDRSFLRRTLEEELSRVESILTAPMGSRRGGGRVAVESVDLPGGDE